MVTDCSNEASNLLYLPLCRYSTFLGVFLDIVSNHQAWETLHPEIELQEAGRTQSGVGITLVHVEIPDIRSSVDFYLESFTGVKDKERL